MKQSKSAFEQMCSIESATLSVERADYLLDDFIERWFSDAGPSDNTIYDVSQRYLIMQTHLIVILEAIANAKAELLAVLNCEKLNVPPAVSENS